jgi:transposase-like protein
LPKSHTPYPEEFRRKMVELVRAGRSPQQLAKEFEPSAQAIRNWVKQADLDEGRRDDALTTTDRYNIYPDMVRISVSGRTARRVESKDSRMGDENRPEERVGLRSAGDGCQPAASRKGCDSSLGPR